MNWKTMLASPRRETLLDRLALFARVLLPSSDCTAPFCWGKFTRAGAGHV